MYLTEERVAMRDAFGESLLSLSQADERVYALDGDLANSTKVDRVAHENPEKFLQMGIAEQNMVGVAAGLAAVGLQPWVTSFAAFTSRRALDQVLVSVAQPRLDVKLVGAYSGLLNGKTGKSHQGLEDIAVMRALPNMTIFAPADAVEVSLVMKWANEHSGPVYIRLARDPSPIVFPSSAAHDVAKAVWLCEGTDVTLVTTGIQTPRAVAVANLARDQGLSVGVLHVPCIKPLDVPSIVSAAQKTGAIVTAEEHNIIGGLGSAVAEALSETWPVPIVRVGVKDKNSESGPSDALLKKYELDEDAMMQAIHRALRMKERFQ
ncbi:transketolase family protein [Alicyclobacillus shizuokensis]|uniref:transketolase family protein n=1 Tax=Alicyclobacillus shizuokensis TaxID=392014 RepID=UPI000A70F8CB|nr:transketolase C-terminal domain-containing protein [Alicyclobacillus shizuokensis]